MMNEWTFNIFRNAYNEFTDTDGKFDGSVLEQYADAVVKDLLDVDQKPVAAESMVVVTVWMAITHYLEVAVEGCKDSNEAGIDVAINALDKAVALWVGERESDGRDYNSLTINLWVDDSCICFKHISIEH